MSYLLAGGASKAFNVGTGGGCSVREGDPAEFVADSTKLRTQLGWTPEFTELEGIVAQRTAPLGVECRNALSAFSLCRHYAGGAAHV